MPSTSLTTRDPVSGLALGLRWSGPTCSAGAPQWSLRFASCGTSLWNYAQRARNAAYCTSSTAF